MSNNSFSFKFNYARLPDSELGLAKCLGPSRYVYCIQYLRKATLHPEDVRTLAMFWRSHHCLPAPCPVLARISNQHLHEKG